jgi:hypothetical protein
MPSEANSMHITPNPDPGAPPSPIPDDPIPGPSPITDPSPTEVPQPLEIPPQSPPPIIDPPTISPVA